MWLEGDEDGGIEPVPSKVEVDEKVSSNKLTFSRKDRNRKKWERRLSKVGRQVRYQKERDALNSDNCSHLERIKVFSALKDRFGAITSRLKRA